MKRLWFGLVLLAVLLAGGIWLTAAMSGIHSDLSDTLSAASLAAQQNNWEAANALADSARTGWEQHRRVTAAFADHEPLEELEQLFSELQICRQLTLEENFAVVCSDLSQICDAIAESFRINWWNVF